MDGSRGEQDRKQKLSPTSFGSEKQMRQGYIKNHTQELLFAKHSLPLWVVKTEGLTDHTSQAFIQGPTTNFRSKKSQLIKKLIN